jgi:hypothetical protein
MKIQSDISSTGEFSELDKLDLLDIPKPLQSLAVQYLDFYEEVKELEGMLKAQKEIMDQIRDELIQELDSIGVKTYDGLESVTLTRSKRQFIKVSDFRGLSNYIEEELNEPLSEYGEFKFSPDKLKPLVDKAKEEMLRERKPLNEVLPKGIELGFTDIITIRTKKE